MRKFLFAGFAVVTILLFSNQTSLGDKGVWAKDKDVKLPDWQWASGNLKMEKTLVKPCFQ